MCLAVRLILPSLQPGSPAACHRFLFSVFFFWDQTRFGRATSDRSHSHSSSSCSHLATGEAVLGLRNPLPFFLFVVRLKLPRMQLLDADRQTDRWWWTCTGSALSAFAPAFMTRLRFPSLRSACPHPASFKRSNTLFLFSFFFQSSLVPVPWSNMSVCT